MLSNLRQLLPCCCKDSTTVEPPTNETAHTASNQLTVRKRYARSLNQLPPSRSSVVAASMTAPPDSSESPRLRVQTQQPTNPLNRLTRTTQNYYEPKKTELREQLLEKIAVWQSYTHDSHPINIATLSKNEQRQVFTWLTGLECSATYINQRDHIADTVCHMLKDVTTSTDTATSRATTFRNTFFDVLSNNLEQPGDRSSTILNTLYSSWKQ